MAGNSLNYVIALTVAKNDTIQTLMNNLNELKKHIEQGATFPIHVDSNFAESIRQQVDTAVKESLRKPRGSGRGVRVEGGFGGLKDAMARTEEGGDLTAAVKALNGAVERLSIKLGLEKAPTPEPTGRRIPQSATAEKAHTRLLEFEQQLSATRTGIGTPALPIKELRDLSAALEQIFKGKMFKAQLDELNSAKNQLEGRARGQSVRPDVDEDARRHFWNSLQKLVKDAGARATERIEAPPGRPPKPIGDALTEGAVPKELGAAIGQKIADVLREMLPQLAASLPRDGAPTSGSSMATRVTTPTGSDAVTATAMGVVEGTEQARLRREMAQKMALMQSAIASNNSEMANRMRQDLKKLEEASFVEDFGMAPGRKPKVRIAAQTTPDTQYGDIAVIAANKKESVDSPRMKAETQWLESVLKKQQRIGLDIETETLTNPRTGKPEAGRIRSIQIGLEESVNGVQSFVLDVTRMSEAAVKRILQYISSDALTKVGQNLQFEFQQLNKQYGIDLGRNVEDTMLNERALFRVQDYRGDFFDKKGQTSLEGLAQKYLKIKLDKTLQTGFEYNDTPLTPAQLRYGALDAVLPLSIARGQRKQAQLYTGKTGDSINAYLQGAGGALGGLATTGNDFFNQLNAMEIAYFQQGMPLQEMWRTFGATSAPALPAAAQQMRTTPSDRVRQRIARAAQWYNSLPFTQAASVESAVEMGYVGVPVTQRPDLARDTMSNLVAKYPLAGLWAGAEQSEGEANRAGASIQAEMRQMDAMRVYGSNVTNVGVLSPTAAMALQNVLYRRGVLDAKQQRTKNLSADEARELASLSDENLAAQYPILSVMPGELRDKRKALRSATTLAAARVIDRGQREIFMPDGDLNRQPGTGVRLSPLVLERMQLSGVSDETLAVSSQYMQEQAERLNLQFYGQTERRQAAIAQAMKGNIKLINAIGHGGELPEEMLPLLARMDEAVKGLPQIKAGMGASERQQAMLDRNKKLATLYEDEEFTDLLRLMSTGHISPSGRTTRIAAGAYQDVLEAAKTNQDNWVREQEQGGVWARPTDALVRRRGYVYNGTPMLMTSGEMRDGELLVDNVRRAHAIMPDNTGLTPPGRGGSGGGGGVPWSWPSEGLPVRVMNWNEAGAFFEGGAGGRTTRRADGTVLMGPLAQRDLAGERDFLRSAELAQVRAAADIMVAQEKAKARVRGRAEAELLEAVKKTTRTPPEDILRQMTASLSGLPTGITAEQYGKAPGLRERDMARSADTLLRAVRDRQYQMEVLATAESPQDQFRGLSAVLARQKKEEVARVQAARMFALDPSLSEDTRQRLTAFVPVARRYGAARSGLEYYRDVEAQQQGLLQVRQERERRLQQAGAMQAEILRLEQQRATAAYREGTMEEPGLRAMVGSQRESYESSQGKAKIAFDALATLLEQNPRTGTFMKAFGQQAVALGLSEQEREEFLRGLGIRVTDASSAEKGGRRFRSVLGEDESVSAGAGLVNVDLARTRLAALRGTIEERFGPRGEKLARMEADLADSEDRAPLTVAEYDKQLQERRQQIKSTLGVATDAGVATRMARLQLTIELVEKKMKDLGKVSESVLEKMSKDLGVDIKNVEALKEELAKLEKQYGDASKVVDEAAVTNAAGRAAGGSGGGRSLGESFLAKVMSLGQYTMAGSVVYTFANVMRNLIRSVTTFESELKRIQGVLDTRSAAAATFLGDQVLKNATEFGVGVTEPLRAAKVFAQIGAGPSEIAQLTRSAVLAQQGAGLEPQQATELLIATRNISAGRVKSEDVVDRVSAIEARYAVGAQDLSEAIQRVGSLATQLQPQMLGSVDAFDTVIGATTAIVERTRITGNQAATALRFILSRLAAPEVARDLQERYKIPLASGEPDDNGVVGNTMRPMMDILSSISREYRRLREEGKTVQANELLTSFAGARQANVAAALLGDFDVVLKAAVESSLAFGDAQERARLQLDTVAGRQEQLSAAFTGLAVTVADSTNILTIFKTGMQATSGLLSLTTNALKEPGFGGLATIGLTAAGGYALRRSGEGLATKAVSGILGANAEGVVGATATSGLTKILRGAGTVGLVLGGLEALGTALEASQYYLPGIASAGWDAYKVSGGVSSDVQQAFRERADSVGQRYGMAGSDVTASTRAAFQAAVEAYGSDRFRTLTDTSRTDDALPGEARAFEAALREQFNQLIPGFSEIKDNSEALSQAFELLRLSTQELGLATEQRLREARASRDDMLSNMGKYSSLSRMEPRWWRADSPGYEIGYRGMGRFDQAAYRDFTNNIFSAKGVDLFPGLSNQRFFFEQGASGVSSLMTLQERTRQRAGGENASPDDIALAFEESLREVFTISPQLQGQYTAAYTKALTDNAQQLGDTATAESVAPSLAQVLRGINESTGQPISQRDREQLTNFYNTLATVSGQFAERAGLSAEDGSAADQRGDVLQRFKSFESQVISLTELAINQRIKAEEAAGRGQEASRLRAFQTQWAREDVRSASMANIKEVSSDYVNMRQRFLQPFINFGLRQADMETNRMLQGQGFAFNEPVAQVTAMRQLTEELGRVEPTIRGEQLQRVVNLTQRVRSATAGSLLQTLEDGNPMINPALAPSMRNPALFGGESAISSADISKEKNRVQMQRQILDQIATNFSSLFEDVPDLGESFTNIREQVATLAANAPSVTELARLQEIGVPLTQQEQLKLKSWFESLLSMQTGLSGIVRQIAQRTGELNEPVLDQAQRALARAASLFNTQVSGQRSVVDATLAAQNQTTLLNISGQYADMPAAQEPMFAARIAAADAVYNATVRNARQQVRDTGMLDGTVRTGPDGQTYTDDELRRQRRAFDLQVQQLRQAAAQQRDSEKNAVENARKQTAAAERDRVTGVEESTRRAAALRASQAETARLETELLNAQLGRGIAAQERAGTLTRSGYGNLLGLSGIQDVIAEMDAARTMAQRQREAAPLQAREGMAGLPGAEGSPDRLAYEERIRGLVSTIDQTLAKQETQLRKQVEGMIVTENERRKTERYNAANGLRGSLTAPIEQVLGDFRAFSYGGGKLVVESLAQTFQQTFAKRFVESTIGENGILGQKIIGAFSQGSLLVNQHLIQTFEAGARTLSQGVAMGLTGRTMTGGEGTSTSSGTTTAGTGPAAGAAAVVLATGAAVGGTAPGGAATAQTAAEVLEGLKRSERKQRRDMAKMAGAQLLGSLGGAQLGGGSGTYAPEGASLGTAIGSMAGDLLPAAALAAIPGGAFILPIVGGLLGGLFGGRKKRSPEADQQIEALAKIERNTRQQVNLLETQTSLLQLDSRFLNVGAGFTVPQYRPFGAGGGGGAMIGDITINVSAGSNASARDIGQEVARVIQGQLSQAGLAFDTRTM